MPTATILGPFAHKWTAEKLASTPLITPARHFIYPRPVPGEEETMARGALELMIYPDAGAAFLATCALGFSDPGMPTALWACPSPEWICAVCGGYAYLIDALAPTQSTHIPLRPVVQVRAAEAERLLLFAGFHTVLAWGQDGIAWQTGRLSWEGVALGEVRDGALSGFGWDMFSDRELPFSVDLQTGQHTGGGYIIR